MLAIQCGVVLRVNGYNITYGIPIAGKLVIVHGIGLNILAVIPYGRMSYEACYHILAVICATACYKLRSATIAGYHRTGKECLYLSVRIIPYIFRLDVVFR